MTKRYLIHCDFCGKRVIVKDIAGLNSLKEVPQAPIPRGFLHLEQEESKKILRALERERERERQEKGEEFKPEPLKLDPLRALPRRKLMKCPSCGRGLVLRKDSTVLPEIKEENAVEEEDYGFGREASAPGQQVPGDAPGGSAPGRSEVPQ